MSSCNGGFHGCKGKGRQDRAELRAVHSILEGRLDRPAAHGDPCRRRDGAGVRRRHRLRHHGRGRFDFRAGTLSGAGGTRRRRHRPQAEGHRRRRGCDRRRYGRAGASRLRDGLPRAAAGAAVLLRRVERRGAVPLLRPRVREAGSGAARRDPLPHPRHDQERGVRGADAAPGEGISWCSHRRQGFRTATGRRPSVG